MLSAALSAVTVALLASGTNAQCKGSGSTAADDLQQNGILPNFQADGAACTYDATGSGAGQAFAAGGNAPGFGDVPYPAEEQTPSILHLPVAIGTIAVYANTGGVDITEGIDAATMCSIFAGNVSSWKSVSASLPDVAPTVIVRADSSGSTAVITDWFTKACRDWMPGQGKEIEWGPHVVKMDGTSGVMGALETTPGGITYASCGPDRAPQDGPLREVPLKNQAGVSLKCLEADFSELDVNPPSFASGDWSAVSASNGIDMFDYPSSFLLYAYVPTDMSASGEEGCNAKAWVTNMLSEPVQTSVLPEHHFAAIPQQLREISYAGLESVATDCSVPVFKRAF